MARPKGGPVPPSTQPCPFFAYCTGKAYPSSGSRAQCTVHTQESAPSLLPPQTWFASCPPHSPPQPCHPHRHPHRLRFLLQLACQSAGLRMLQCPAQQVLNKQLFTFQKLLTKALIKCSFPFKDLSGRSVSSSPGITPIELTGCCCFF